MKIALTGATGFIGTVLLKELAATYGKDNITVIASRPISGFKCVVYDKNEFGFIGDDIVCDVLIHAGAYIPKSGVDANVIEKCNLNIIFTQNLLKKIKLCGKIFNISSSDIYAADEIVNEKSRVSPVSLYGMSKLYCEKIVDVYSTEKNIKSTHFRIGHVYGEGEEEYKKIIPLTMARLIAGESIEIWGDGSDLRSFIHVRDVVKAIIAAVPLELDEHVVNVVSGNAVSIRELVGTIASFSGVPAEIKYLPAKIKKRDLVFDNSLLRERLLPCEMDLIEGLKSEYQYMAKLNEHNF